MSSFICLQTSSVFVLHVSRLSWVLPSRFFFDPWELFLCLLFVFINFFFENCTAIFFRILYASISVAFSFFLRIIHVSQYHLVLLQCYIILFELYVFVSFLLELDAPAHLLFCIVLVLICSFMSHRSVILTSSSS